MNPINETFNQVINNNNDGGTGSNGNAQMNEMTTMNMESRGTLVSGPGDRTLPNAVPLSPVQNPMTLTPMSVNATMLNSNGAMPSVNSTQVFWNREGPTQSQSLAAQQHRTSAYAPVSTVQM